MGDFLGFDTYRKACYGDRDLSPVQLHEVEQAFLSGIVQAFTTHQIPAMSEHKDADLRLLYSSAVERLVAMGCLPNANP